MPSDLVLRALNTVHQGVLRVSGGRIGGRLKGMPVVELTTVGRRSGLPRTVVLTSPLRRDGAWVVVASRGGDGRYPAWYLNLRDHPDVDVRVTGEGPRAMRARVPVDDERAALWRRVTADYPHYGRYEEKAGRPIPLVLLEPRG